MHSWDIKAGKNHYNILFREKKKREKKGGVSDSRLDIRTRGGGHSDAYCVQQGGGVV